MTEPTMTGTTMDIPVSILTMEQYASIPMKNLESTFPIALYDDGQYPVRLISVYPVPNRVSWLTLWLWQPLINTSDLDAEISFPPGYERALRFNLAVELAAEFGKEIPPQVAMIAAESWSKLKRLNTLPQIMDLSIQSHNRWNWITGGFYNWR